MAPGSIWASYRGSMLITAVLVAANLSHGGCEHISRVRSPRLQALISRAWAEYDAAQDPVQDPVQAPPTPLDKRHQDDLARDTEMAREPKLKLKAKMYSRLIATLLRLFGSSHQGHAEVVVQPGVRRDLQRRLAFTCTSLYFARTTLPTVNLTGNADCIRICALDGRGPCEEGR